LFHPGIHRHLEAQNIYWWQRDIDCLATGRVKIIEEKKKKKNQATKRTRKIAPLPPAMLPCDAPFRSSSLSSTPQLSFQGTRNGLPV